MWRLLEMGEEKQVGDELYSPRLREWIPIREDTFQAIFQIVDKNDLPIRRKIED